MSSTNSNALVVAGKIDEISKSAMDAFLSPESFAKEISVAQAVADMRALLTPDVMAPIMALMNTGLGFDTDKNPNKAKPGEQVTPYSVDVVREVFIESRLRGFHCVGNEFNIIAGKFYGGLAGFERKVKTHPKVTNFKDNFSVPVMMGDKGALVKASAEWHQDGQKQTLEREFGVRVNAGMGADAIIGKAKRKLYAAVLGRLTGTVTPEGDQDDVVNVSGQATQTQAAPSTDGMFTKPQPTEQAKGEPETVQMAIERMMRECQVSFDDFRSFIQTKGLVPDASVYSSFHDLPGDVCAKWNASPKLAAECIKKFGKVQAK